MKRMLGCALAALALGNGALHAQGTVQGTVRYPDGTAARNCSVEAFPIQEGGFVANLMWTNAGGDGNFTLSLPDGRYEIRAKDEAHGYADPNALLSFDDTAVFPEIEVSNNGDVSGVEVRLGRQGGILEGTVRDVTTAKAIPNTKITIRDLKTVEAFIELFSDKSGYFRYTLPPKAVSVSADAAGYATYRFQSGRALKLGGGEHRLLDIPLQRK